MKIFYDYEILCFQKYGGVSRYFYEIINEMRQSFPEIKPVIKAAVSINYYFRDEIRMRDYLPRHGNGPRNEFSAVSEILKSRVSGKPFDIIHPTFYYPNYLYRFPSLKGNAKTVITVHDFVHEKFYPELINEIEAKKKAMFMADGLICVSENTRKDMLEIYPELSNKPNTVIYHGFFPSDTEYHSDFHFPEKYLLFVGRRDEYKEFRTALKGFKAFISDNKDASDYMLFAAGGGGFSIEEKRVIEELNISDKVIQADLSDNDLSFAYRHALCFIYTSSYEGFGIPILEAYAGKCPVILNDSSCFPEIAGESALYYGGSPDELAVRIKDVLSFSKEERESLINSGMERLKRFSWKKAAEETIRFYRTLLELKNV